MIKILFFIILASLKTYAVDFTVEITPAANSISDSQISSISSSKISGLGSLATKSTITNSDVANGAISSAKISGLGPLSFKSIVTNVDIADGSVTSAKLFQFSASVISAMASTLTNYLLKTDIKAPTVTKCTSSSVCTWTASSPTISGQNYIPPSGTKYIRIRMVGGGGGGQSSGRATSDPVTDRNYAGGSGNSTIFASLLIAGGGGGAGTNGPVSATGGSVTINSPAVGIGINGASGIGNNYSASLNDYYFEGAPGASSFFGGAGGSSLAGNGSHAAVNSGSGGGGGGKQVPSAGVYSGAGGAAGGYIDAILTDLSVGTYAFNVGLGGAGGIAGSSNYFSGGNGGSGFLEITEYYQ